MLWCHKKLKLHPASPSARGGVMIREEREAAQIYVRTGPAFYDPYF